jgi:uncharacterized lipoprotein YajG
MIYLSKKDVTMRLKVVLLGLTISFLAGCQGAPITTNYTPSSLIQGKGSIQVQPFAYAPADAGKTKPDQIPNSAIGQLHLNKPVGTYVSDAFASEFKYAGFQLDDSKHSLVGTVQEFKVDDLGFSADWSVKISVELKGKSGHTIAQKDVVIKKNMQKFGEINVAVNSLIKEAFEQMMNDPQFKKHLQ